MAQLWANHLVIDIRKGTLTMNKIVEAFLKGEKVREKRWNKGDFEQRKGHWMCNEHGHEHQNLGIVFMLIDRLIKYPEDWEVLQDDSN